MRLLTNKDIFVFVLALIAFVGMVLGSMLIYISMTSVGHPDGVEVGKIYETVENQKMLTCRQEIKIKTILDLVARQEESDAVGVFKNLVNQGACRAYVPAGQYRVINFSYRVDMPDGSAVWVGEMIFEGQSTTFFGAFPHYTHPEEIKPGFGI